METVTHMPHTPTDLSRIWREIWSKLLALVDVSKGAVAGAGVVIACVGIVNLFSKLIAPNWFSSISDELVDVGAVLGAFVGGLIVIIFLLPGQKS